MRRSDINHLIEAATACFEAHGWALPPAPRWDVTDFGLGDWRTYGLVLVNLSEQPEYCEKLMYAQRGMTAPCHAHRKKKEDIICRWGRIKVRLWPGPPDEAEATEFEVPVNGWPLRLRAGDPLELPAGHRVTIVPGVYHDFTPLSSEAILGEVSTYNDDAKDNVFVDPAIGRFPGIEEDAPPLVRLVGETVA